MRLRLPGFLRRKSLGEKFVEELDTLFEIYGLEGKYDLLRDGLGCRCLRLVPTHKDREEEIPSGFVRALKILIVRYNPFLILHEPPTR